MCDKSVLPADARASVFEMCNLLLSWYSDAFQSFFLEHSTASSDKTELIPWLTWAEVDTDEWCVVQLTVSIKQHVRKNKLNYIYIYIYNQ